ncbi:MAG: molybdopterin synthase catalytic subunit MoaE [Pseudomonadota bacterium]
MITIQEEDFDVADLLDQLTSQSAGACVNFIGRVRNHNQGQSVTGLFIEHYPAMTQSAIEAIVEKARERWQIERVVVVHRIGHLELGNNIVFVGIASAHRHDAFHACEFIMDFLKNRAPFWKKETTEIGERWVEFNEKDREALEHWLK